MSLLDYGNSTATLQPMNSALRLLAVHAHPDDESSKGAATTARYVDEGVEVIIATATGGERGDLLNKNLVLEPGYNLAEIRKAEMANAVKALGCKHVWLGHMDSGFPEGDPKPPLPKGCFADIDLEVAAACLVKLIREFKPQVITTYDENGGYPHPDHIRTHEITMYAYQKAQDPTYDLDLPPWQVSKIYYDRTITKRKILAAHKAIQDQGIDSPYTDWLDRWEVDGFDRVTTQVHVADYFERRDAALLAHATQVDPAGMWFAFPRDIERKIWPTEDFELAVSNIERIEQEDDLFGGLR